MSGPKSGPIQVTAGNAVEAADILRKFLEPFDAAEVKLKPAMVKNNRCLALHYIDSRLVMDRLDEVVGVGGWKDEYTVLPSGEVECRLSVKIGGEWVTKADVGGQSEQPDEGDRMKAAYSDALKRAAVKFGIGRFLYRLPQQWMDYDPVKKQIIRPTPQQPQQVKPQAQQPAARPPANNLPLRAKLAADIGGAPTRDALAALWRQIEANGQLTAADKDTLLDLCKQSATRFAKPQAATAK